MAWDLFLVEWHGWLKELYFDRGAIWPFLLINDEIIWMLYNLYDLSNSCWYGGYEVFGGLTDYGAAWTDADRLQDNIVNDLGFIYTNIRDIIFFFLQNERAIIRSLFELGKSFGQLYYFIFISGFFATVINTVAPVQIDPATGTIVFLD